MKPLDQQMITHVAQNGKEEVIPALDPRRIIERRLIKYTPPLMDNDIYSSPADEMQVYDEWKERMHYIVEDMDWLLRLPHDLFWCQVIYDASLHELLDSFLLYAPRHYDNTLVKDYCKAIHTTVCKYVFLLLVRIATDKESEDNFITPSVFGEIIYDNFLFDIPKLFDICSILYGKDGKNQDVLSKVILNVFEKQKKYYDDLEASLGTIFETIAQMCQRLGLQNEQEDGAPVKIGQKEDAITEDELHDIILYLYDTGHTLHSFLTILPPAVHTFEKFETVTRLALVCENLLPEVQDRLAKGQDPIWHIHCSRTFQNFLQIVHLINKYSFLVLPATCSEHEMTHSMLEGYVHSITSVLSYKRFLYYYDKEYDVKSEFDKIKGNNTFVDDTHIKFILDAVEEAKNSFVTPGTSDQFSASEETTIEDVSQAALQDAIGRVKDLFPHLTDNFLQQAMMHYSSNEHLLVNALLEDSLPSELAKLMTDDNPTPGPSRSHDNGYLVAEEFHKRQSNTTLGKEKYYKGGRRRGEEDTTTVLVDKEQASYVKDYVQKLEEREFQFDEYDDEYDDTYDSQNVGAIDADSADELDELTKRRAFVTPIVLRRAEKSGDKSLDESDEDVPEKASEQRENNDASSVNKLVMSKVAKVNRNSADPNKPSYQRHSGKSHRGKLQQGNNHWKEEDNEGPRRGNDVRGQKNKIEHSHPRGQSRGGRASARSRIEKAPREGDNGTVWNSRHDTGQFHQGRDFSKTNMQAGFDDDRRSVGDNFDSKPPNVDGTVANAVENGSDYAHDNKLDKDMAFALSNQAATEREPKRNFRSSEGNKENWRRRGTDRGRGKASEGRGRGRGHGHRGWQDKHHQKDRAAQKMSRGMGPLPRD